MSQNQPPNPDECRCVFVGVKPYCGHCGKPYPSRTVPPAISDAEQVKCPKCQRELQPTRNGFIPIHAGSVEEELKEVNPKACRGSGISITPTSAARERERVVVSD